MAVSARRWGLEKASCFRLLTVVYYAFMADARYNAPPEGFLKCIKCTDYDMYLLPGKIVKIGCIERPLDWWLKNYEIVGKLAGYTEPQIREYGTKLLRFCVKEN